MATAAPVTALLLVCGLYLSPALAASGLDEERLLTYLRRAASHPLARPVQDAQFPVIVVFGITMHGFQVDEQEETLHMNSWLSLEWKDFYLHWNISHYNGLRSVRVPTVNIWHPDIQVYNSKQSERHHDERAVLYADGNVGYVARAETSTPCELDLTYFPFDTHTCSITFGSWTYSGSDLNLTHRSDNIDLESFSPNKAWHLLETSVHRLVSTYECCPDPYITLTYFVKFRRVSSYFVYIYVAPALLFSLLGAAIFILPSGSTQKMMLGGALLICFGLFFLDIGQVLPAVHIGTPIIDKYYMATYAMLAVSVFLSAVITNLANRSWSNSHPPTLLKKVVLGCLGRLVCMAYTPYTNLHHDTEELSDVKVDGSRTGSDGSKQHKNPDLHIKDWLLIATVLDRLFLICYVLLTGIVTLSILLNYTQT